MGLWGSKPSASPSQVKQSVSPATLQVKQQVVKQSAPSAVSQVKSLQPTIQLTSIYKTPKTPASSSQQNSTTTTLKQQQNRKLQQAFNEKTKIIATNPTQTQKTTHFTGYMTIQVKDKDGTTDLGRTIYDLLFTNPVYLNLLRQIGNNVQQCDKTNDCNKWVYCSSHVNCDLMKTAVEIESKSTAYMMACFSPQLPRGTTPLWKFVRNDTPGNITGVWKNDSRLFDLSSSSENKMTAKFFLAAGPSASGKTSSGGNLIQLFYPGETFFCIDGGDYRQNLHTWQWIVLVMRKKGYSGLSNLMLSGSDVAEWIKGKLGGIGTIFDAGDIKNLVVSYIADQQKKAKIGAINIYLPDTLNSKENVAKTEALTRCVVKDRTTCLIYMHKTRFDCPFAPSYRCVGCDTGKKRAIIQGKKYSASNYDKSLENGLMALCSKGNTFLYHNSGQQGHTSILQLISITDPVIQKRITDLTKLVGNTDTTTLTVEDTTTRDAFMKMNILIPFSLPFDNTGKRLRGGLLDEVNPPLFNNTTMKKNIPKKCPKIHFMFPTMPIPRTQNQEKQQQSAIATITMNPLFSKSVPTSPQQPTTILSPSPPSPQVKTQPQVLPPSPSSQVKTQPQVLSSKQQVKTSLSPSPQVKTQPQVSSSKQQVKTSSQVSKQQGTQNISQVKPLSAPILQNSNQQSTTILSPTISPSPTSNNLQKGRKQKNQSPSSPSSPTPIPPPVKISASTPTVKISASTPSNISPKGRNQKNPQQSSIKPPAILAT